MKRIIIFPTILLMLFLSSISGKQLLTIVSPNGGEKLSSGSNIQIKWKYDDQSSANGIILILYRDGIKFLTISKSTADSGLFLWKIPENIPSGGKYRIRIRSTRDLSLNDFSDGDFSIMKK